MPPPRRQAGATYRSQLPNATFAAVSNPQPQPPLDRRSAASASREYQQQLTMAAFRPGLLVDSYA